MNFALTGLAGYIAPRHLKAIAETENQLLAALDPHDSVGVIDQHFPSAYFFSHEDDFADFVLRQQRLPQTQRIHYLTICTPNHLHNRNMIFAMENGMDAVCEKPLIVNMEDMDALAACEARTGRRIYTVLQLRVHPTLMEVAEKLHAEQPRKRCRVSLCYVTRRGRWYSASWKGDEQKSGGLAMNIGIHFFDMLSWFFGAAQENIVTLNTPEKMAGQLVLQHADVDWFLSIDGNDLPQSYRQAGRTAFRSIQMDGQEIEFSDGFTDLHTAIYRGVLAGQGFGLAEARPSIELASGIRHSRVLAHAYIPQSISALLNQH
jgi:UDP-N-acetyl-2-amino-2-deoxyglucuronate dehydrogenase